MKVTSGKKLLKDWGCTTREAKLERATIALMDQLDTIHLAYNQEHLKGNKIATCSCADAYRMGKEALKP